MALDGLLALACAGAVVAAGPLNNSSAGPADNRDSLVTTALAVQTALQKGKDHLLRGEYSAAVDVLESQLPHIDGNRVYLKLLQDAYRSHIKELRLTKQDAEARRYLQRLLLLDRGALLDTTLTGMNLQPAGATPTPAAASQDASTKSTVSAPAKPQPTVRLKSDDEPFPPARTQLKQDDQARSLLARADEEFGSRHYNEARLLYKQANEVDKNAIEPSRDRWAYCELFHVVDQLNHSSSANLSWPELEQDTRLALSLAPRMEYAKYLLTEIQKRRSGASAADATKQGTDVAVRNVSRTQDGWYVAETANFRIFHQSQELAERTAQVAERTRFNVHQKWFGAAGDPWIPKCDLYLHPTADAYSRATGQYGSPIDLHSDDQNMLTAILPHETTHVVLAGQFGERLLPRWADEGMAVLTEPRDKIERHLANLTSCRQNGQLLSLQELMQRDDYPQNPQYIGAFYAESVSLVEFLSNQKGPLAFTMFLHDGLRYGYEKALQRHYGLRSFAELEQRWGQYAAQQRAALTGVAER